MSSKGITENDLKAVLNEVLPSFVADYVCETGTNNNWDYRKWNSGYFEAWQNYNATGLTLTSSSSGTYYGTDKEISLPSFIVSYKGCVFGESPSLSSGVWIYACSRNNNNMKINYRAHASQSNAVCGGWFYLRGTWK